MSRFVAKSAFFVALSLGVCPFDIGAQALAEVENPVISSFDTAAHQQAAYRFAQVLRTRESVLAESRYTFTGALAAEMQADPDIAELEADYPGITQHMLLKSQNEIERQVIESLPELWTTMAELFVQAMTPAELADGYGYYSSPAGQRLVNSALQNFDYQTLTKVIVASPDAKISADDLDKSMRAGIPKTVAGMSSLDQAELMAFSKTTAFSKIRELGPKVGQVAADWANKSTPEEDKRIFDIMNTAVEEFIATADST